MAILNEKEKKFVEDLGISWYEADYYLRKLVNSPNPIVLKAGGVVMEGENTLPQDLGFLCNHGVESVLVYGGKGRISEAGVEPTFDEDGNRKTSEEDLPKIKSALLDVGHKFREELRKYDVESEVLDGVIISEKVNDPENYVGKPTGIDNSSIEEYIEDCHFPLVSPFSKEGYNVNSDPASATMAVELGSEKLVMLTNEDGVLDAEGSVIPILPKSLAENLIKDDAVDEGMKPKVENAIYANENGVSNVQIINGTKDHALLYELFKQEGFGTMIDYSL